MEEWANLDGTRGQHDSGYQCGPEAGDDSVLRRAADRQLDSVRNGSDHDLLQPADSRSRHILRSELCHLRTDLPEHRLLLDGSGHSRHRVDRRSRRSWRLSRSHSRCNYFGSLFWRQTVPTFRDHEFSTGGRRHRPFLTHWSHVVDNHPKHRNRLGLVYPDGPEH